MIYITAMRAVIFLVGFTAPIAAFMTIPVTPKSSSLKMGVFGGGRNAIPKIPSSPSDRDRQAIDGVKAAIASPKDPSFPLVECEFPPLEALNKLGDGSLRSTIEVEKANVAFCAKLLKSIAPFPFVGPKTWLLLSPSASGGFVSKAKTIVKGATVHSLKDGIPEIGAEDVCVLVAPCSRNDYEAAKTIASQGIAIVIVNGLAKDTKSVPQAATMGYFQKPLTYNSAVVGYLLRSYPGQWATIDALTKEVLGTFADSEIIVRGTNTPDLRTSGRLVQKSVDERAIRARRDQ